MNTISQTGAEEARSVPETARLLRAVKRELDAKPFRPHKLFAGGHAQTIVAYAWPRRTADFDFGQREDRYFDVEPGVVRVLAHCHWQTSRRAERPTVVLVHGLEGSGASVYMISTARLFFRAGFNVLRYNMRNCGGTEHLTPTLYHSGMSDDLRHVLGELIGRDGLRQLFLVGHSMGGNVSLKLAGEYGADPPAELRGVCAVSPALDLRACAEAINRRSNWIYQRRFLKSLRRRMRHKQRLYPQTYDMSLFRAVRSIRDFDEHYTARHHGFADADDYYERSSAIKVLAGARVPVLIIHAQDDPFIPFESFRRLASFDNPHLLLLAPPHGGHVGFVSDDPRERFWAEARLVDFCRRLSDPSGDDADRSAETSACANRGESII